MIHVWGLAIAVAAALSGIFVIRYLYLPADALAGAVLGTDSVSGKPKRVILYIPVFLLVNSYRLYLATAWAALCVFGVNLMIANPNVTIPVFYRALGLCVCLVPLIMWARDTYRKKGKYSLPGLLIILAMVLSYVAFAMKPMAIYYIHWWWLGLLT